MKLESIERASQACVATFAPPQQARRPDVDPTQPKKSDIPGVGLTSTRHSIGTFVARSV